LLDPRLLAENRGCGAVSGFGVPPSRERDDPERLAASAIERQDGQRRIARVADILG